MPTTSSTEQPLPTTPSTVQPFVFDYRTLRLLLSIVAFVLPLAVLIVSQTRLPSISASYHTGARDIFVGTLFVIGTLFVAYKGHRPIEDWMANFGAVAAFVAALFPTSCDICEPTRISTIHLIAGATLFLVIAYFCLGPFRQRATDQSKTKPNPKAMRRVRVYSVCGWLIILSILCIGIAQFTLAAAVMNAWSVTFLGELIAMWAFGSAWLVASKILPQFADKDERLPVSLNVGLPNGVKKFLKK